MDNEEEIVNLFDEGDAEPIQAVTATVVPDEAPAFEIPKKFEGKSVEDVIESYINLEKDNGRKSNEIGELRKLTDDILRKQVAYSPDENEFINESAEEDFDYFDDPAKAVDRAIANNPRMKQLEAQIEADSHKKAHDDLIASHSDADEVVASDGFNQWIKGSNGRLKMLQDAHNSKDVELASDLLSMYKQTAGVINEEARTERDAVAAQELRSAVVERGQPSPNSKPVYRRADLIRLKVEQPSRYEGMAAEIREAYADGRVK